ncbi:MAG: DUF5989 family protein [Candidatus Sumerlaeia bacterium]|nr:DUF5989 family protein [Candidatus Sumerlaeia bacterium]
MVDFLLTYWWRILIVLILLAIPIYFVIYFKDRVAIIGEFLQFLKERKMLWMMPIIIVFLLLSIFIIVAEKSVVLPFIYTLF